MSPTSPTPFSLRSRLARFMKLNMLLSIDWCSLCCTWAALMASFLACSGVGSSPHFHEAPFSSSTTCRLSRIVVSSSLSLWMGVEGRPPATRPDPPTPLPTGVVISVSLKK